MKKSLIPISTALLFCCTAIFCADIASKKWEQYPPALQTESMLFNGLTDSHTVEMTLPDGTVQPFQFAAASEVAAAFSSLQAGDGVTICYDPASLKIVAAK